MPAIFEEIKVKPLYVSATGQNVGKTTVILGLFAAMCDRGVRPGYIKPVGQRYNEVDGVRADEDERNSRRRNRAGHHKEETL